MAHALTMRETMEAWLFISPTLAGFLIFFVGPLIAVVYYSLTEWNLLAAGPPSSASPITAMRCSRNPDFWPSSATRSIFADRAGAAQHGAGPRLGLALSRPLRRA